MEWKMKNTTKRIKLNKKLKRKMQYSSQSYISIISITTVNVKWLSHDRTKTVEDPNLEWCYLFIIPASYILIY
jgi:hypothetical protein